jgi:glycosyltransferase involved in cell wall biosynthesis
MKILLLSHFLPPVFGGVERHVFTLAKALMERNHDVTAITFATETKGPLGAGVTVSEGVRIVRVRTSASRIPKFYIDPTLPWSIPLPDPAVSRAIRQELRRGGFDVVHAHDWSLNSAMGPAARSHVPLVVTMHDYGHSCATRRMLEFGTTQCPGPSVKRCVSCVSTYYGGVVKGSVVLAANSWTARRRSREVVSFASVSGIVDDSLQAKPPWLRGTSLRSKVIPNFIPDDIVVEEIPEAAQDAPLVYVGTVRADKGVQVLLDAYQLLESPPRLVIAGPLEAGTEWNFPDGVVWLGEQPREKIIELYRTSCAVLVPSIFPDPCPTVVLEAMAAGRPVIGASSGGIVDMIVDDVTGYLIPPSDVSALANAMEKLLNDPGRAVELGRAGRDRAREFTATAVVDRIERMYTDAITEFKSKEARE